MQALINSRGDYAAAGFIAHEWGHAIARLIGYGYSNPGGEYLADCLAGMSTRWGYLTGRLVGSDYNEFRGWLSSQGHVRHPRHRRQPGGVVRLRLLAVQRQPVRPGSALRARSAAKAASATHRRRWATGVPDRHWTTTCEAPRLRPGRFRASAVQQGSDHPTPPGGPAREPVVVGPPVEPGLHVGAHRQRVWVRRRPRRCMLPSAALSASMHRGRVPSIVRRRQIGSSRNPTQGVGHGCVQRDVPDPGRQGGGRPSVRGGDARGSRAEFEALQARSGTTRETWAMQETPMGSFMLVWFEGDVEKAFADLATDDSEFMTWFRGRVLDVTGVDLGAPPDGPPPAVLVDWHA